MCPGGGDVSGGSGSSSPGLSKFEGRGVSSSSDIPGHFSSVTSGNFGIGSLHRSSYLAMRSPLRSLCLEQTS